MYIGYTITLSLRKTRHFSQLRKNKHFNPYLQASWNKYGEDNFIFEILEECDNDYLHSQEHYWINMLNTLDPKYGYNIGLPNPNGKGTRHSKETIEKIKRNTPSPKGRKTSEKTKQLLRISNKNNGKNRSEEGILKWRNSVQKPVVQYDLDMNFIAEFPSLISASKFLNKTNSTSILYCCQNKTKKCYGYIWKYKTDV